MNKFDVLIVGAGYAGLMCALRLAARVKGRPVKIGVVNPSAGFVERLRLHEGLADGASLLRPLDLHHVLKKTGIALIAGRVVSLDRAAQRVGVETAGAVGDVDDRRGGKQCAERGKDAEPADARIKQQEGRVRLHGGGCECVRSRLQPSHPTGLVAVQ